MIRVGITGASVLFCVLCSTFTSLACADVWYVDIENNSGTEDGTSWATAFTTIQAGLDAAGASDEVWVTAGTYTSASDPIVTMATDVDLYGGFDGSETIRNDRDWESNVTIVDGEDARRCIWGADGADVDGFTITRGASSGGSGVRALEASFAISNCIFSDNESGSSNLGGAVRVDNASVYFVDCVFVNNGAGLGGAVGVRSAGAGDTSVFENCIFTENYTTQSGGGAINTTNASAIFESCTFSYNESKDGVGAVEAYVSSLHPDASNLPETIMIDNCTFVGNTNLDRTPGGALVLGSMISTIRNCEFIDNSTNDSAFGGGTLAIYGGQTTISNCVLRNNHEIGGGWTAASALLVDESFSFNNNALVEIVNCTILGNETDSGGLILSEAESVVNISNSIIWNNSPNSIIQNDTSNVSIDYSIVEGGFPGTGNINIDPQFVDAANGNLHLRYNSPAIDTGTSSGAPTTDIDGVSRPQRDGIDMGAYEFDDPYPLDSDGDGMPDSDEENAGLDVDTVDANLFAMIDYPSHGSSFRPSQGTVIELSGRLSSPYINQVRVSTDGGSTFDKIASISGLTWSYNWTPPTETGTPYEIAIRAMNSFEGYTATGPIDVTYSVSPPHAVISSPVAGEHVRGVITVTGSAQDGQLDFGSYSLHYGEGSDPDSVSVWNALPGNPYTSPVPDGILVPSWNVSAIPDGDYVLRLQVVDGSSVLTSTTYVPLVVDNDYSAPSAPSSLTIEGQILPNVVADGKLLDVVGTAPVGTQAYEALVVDGDSLAAILDATSSITIHKNGSVRGTVTLPSGITADQIALQLRVQDAVGNASSPKLSNFLLVDNDPPSVSIEFPVQNSTFPLSELNISGTSSDAISGVEKVEFRPHNDEWSDATGTTDWSYLWTPTKEVNHTLKAQATDVMGNTSLVNVTDIIINSAWPSGTITSPTFGQQVNAGEVLDVIGTASDTTNFNFFSVQYAPDGGSFTDIVSNVTTPVPTEGTLATWNTSGLSSGLHILRLLVLDDDFNITNVDIEVNIVAPLSIDGIPDTSLSEDGFIQDFVHLPDYASALTGDVSSMDYRIVNGLDPDVISAGITLDAGNNIDIDPVANWNGTASVTVEVDDGTRTNKDIFVVTVLAVNDPPTAPVVSITPVTPLDADDLTVNVVTPSTDIEGATSVYSYAWFKSTDGGNSYASTGNISTTVGNASTAEGEFWRCEVTPNDGATNGPTALATVRIVQEGGISVNASPLQLPLGNTVDLTGGISPNIADAQGQGVDFTGTLKPSGGDSIPSTTTNSSSEFVVNDFLPNRGGTWQIEASWSGNGSLSGSSSALIPVSVTPVTPTLDVTLATQTAEVGFTNQTVTVTLDAGLPSALDDVLAGVEVELNIREHDGTSRGPLTANTDANGVATFAPVDFASAGIVFGKKADASDAPGKWEFLASIDGDNNLTPATSPNFGEIDTPFMTLKDGAGYAIIVVGQLDDNAEGLPEHSKTADNVYRAMRDQGLADEDIYYMRAHGGSPYPVDEVNPSQDTFLNAISLESGDGSFLIPKLNASAAPVWIVMIDHGGGGDFRDEVFYLFDGATGPAGELTPGELNTELNSVDLVIGENELVIVNGSCYSGAFVNTLSKSGRIIVTSAAADQVSYRGVIDPDDGIRDGEVFVTELFRALGSGLGLSDAFVAASAQTDSYTSDSTNGNGESVQTPVLDANGDGEGTIAPVLSTLADTDGAEAYDVTLGFSTNAGGSGVGWSNAAQTIQSDDAIDLYANATNNDAGHEAWIEIKTPTYSGGTETDPLNTDLQQAVALTRIDADTPYPTDGHFTFNGNLGTLFDTPGTYKVYYYIKDATSGVVSSYLLTTVYREQVGNNPPDDVTNLAYPTASTVTTTTVQFLWGEVTDPDGDSLTYTLEVATDSAFNSIAVTREGLTNNYVTLTGNDGLADLTTYYWRVIPVDEFGTAATGTPIFETFTTNNTNGCSSTSQIKVVPFVCPSGDCEPSFTIPPELTAMSSGEEDDMHAATVELVYSGAARGADSVVLGRHIFDDFDDVLYTISVTGADGYEDTTEATILGICGTFRSIYVPVTPLPPDNADDAAKQARYNFDRYDTNNDGVLSYAEWISWGLGADAFGVIDNGNGNVTMDELLTQDGLTPNSMATVYVNFGPFEVLENRDGTITSPFRTLGEALAMVTHDGSGEIRMRGNRESSETFTGVNRIDNTLVLSQYDWGVVQIGVPDALPDSAPSQYASQDVIVVDKSDDGDFGTISFLLSDSERAAELQAFNNAIFEAVIPTTTDADGNHIVSADGTIAIRLRDYSGLDLQTLWAELNPEHGAEEVVFEWIPATADADARDIWILFDPNDTWRMADLLNAIAGGTTLDGFDVQGEVISALIDDDSDSDVVTLDPVSVLNEDGTVTNAWQVGPDQVFREPVEVTIPIPAGIEASSARVMYYKPSDPNEGWHDTGDVVGLLAETPVIQDGMVTLILRHGGILAIE